MAATKGLNSFESLNGANDYFLQGLNNNAWIGLDSHTRQQALVTAASQINMMLISSCQLPQEASEISVILSNANSELALYYALDTSRISLANTGNNTKRVKAGSAEVEFFRAIKGSRFPSLVMQLLTSSGCVASSSSIGGAAAYGTDAQSSFSNSELYNKTEGYP